MSAETASLRHSGALLVTTLTFAGAFWPSTATTATINDIARWESAGNTDALLLALTDPLPVTRQAARSALARMNEPLGDLVARSLEGSAEARKSLAQRKDPRAIAPLVAAFGKPFAMDASLRAGAIQTLKELGDPRSVAALMEIIRLERHPTLQESAYWALGGFKHPQAAPLFVRGLDSPWLNIRIAAAWGLAEVMIEDAIPRVTALLRDPTMELRAAAAWSFIKCPSPTVLPVLIELLEDPARKVRESAIWALSASRDPVALKPLIARLADREVTVRTAAAAALTQFGTTAVPALLNALSDPAREVREEAAKSLWKLNDPLGWNLLNSLAGDETAMVEFAGRRDARAVPILLRLLDSTDPALRASAAAVIARAPQARDVLFDMAGGWNLRERWLATQILFSTAPSVRAQLGALLRIANYAGTMTYLLLIALLCYAAVRLGRRRLRG